MRVSSSSEMSPRSARKRWMRSTSSSVLSVCSARTKVARATSTSVNVFFTWANTWRRMSSTSKRVTRVAARALSSRRARLPPSSIVWPTVTVYSWAVAPNFSAVYEALGFGRSPAVISPARVTSSSKRFELDVTRAGEITAGLRPNPSASYTAEKFGATAQEYTVTVGQTIELGGKRARRLDSARAATRVTRFEVDDIRRQVFAQVKKTFTDVLVARATLVLAEQTLKTLDDVERIQRFRAERGDISELELTRIQLQRFTFERDAADARQAIAATTIAMRALVGAASVAPDVEVLGDLGFRDVGVSRDEAVQRALTARPDLQAA